MTFTVPFSEAPSVLVTPYVSNTQEDIDTPLVAPTVYEITPSSFLVKFWTFIPASGGNLNIFSFIERAFSFAALEITTKRKVDLLLLDPAKTRQLVDKITRPAAALHRATLQAYTNRRLAVIQLPIPPSPTARNVRSVLAEMRSFSCCHTACN